MGIFSASLALLASLNELTAATGSILGMFIFALGVTWVFPVTSQQHTDLSFLAHLRYTSKQHAFKNHP